MNITIFAIFKDKAKFFIRVANGFEGEYDVTFTTATYHSYQIIKKASYKVYILQEFKDGFIKLLSVDIRKKLSKNSKRHTKEKFSQSGCYREILEELK